MGVEKPDPQVWLYNFTCSVSQLILEEIDAGYSVKAVVISRSIFEKMTEITGYEPTQICGYVIELLPELEVDPDALEYFDEQEDELRNYVGLKSFPVN